MNKKDALEQIKNLLKFNEEVVEDTTVTVEESFSDAMLVDGETMVRVDADEFAEGLPIFIVTEDGSDVLPDDTYTLEDGRVLEVVEGKISTISVPESTDESDETPAVDTVVEEVMSEEVVDTTIKDEMILRIEKLEETLKSMVDNQSKTATAVEMMSKLIIDLGSEVPANIEDLNFKSEYSTKIENKKNSITSKLEEIRNIRKK